METIKSVAFEWSADDVQRIVNNLSEEHQMRIDIDDFKAYLEQVIEDNKYDIISFINGIITDSIIERL
jgi:hypothetical protein